MKILWDVTLRGLVQIYENSLGCDAAWFGTDL
jgi:hypothetical protein